MTNVKITVKNKLLEITYKDKKYHLDNDYHLQENGLGYMGSFCPESHKIKHIKKFKVAYQEINDEFRYKKREG